MVTRHSCTPRQRDCGFVSSQLDLTQHELHSGLPSVSSIGHGPEDLPRRTVFLLMSTKLRTFLSWLACHRNATATMSGTDAATLELMYSNRDVEKSAHCYLPCVVLEFYYQRFT
jgi:hypothetical protein